MGEAVSTRFILVFSQLHSGEQNLGLLVRNLPKLEPEKSLTVYAPSLELPTHLPGWGVSRMTSEHQGRALQKLMNGEPWSPYISLSHLLAYGVMGRYTSLKTSICSCAKHWTILWPLSRLCTLHMLGLQPLSRQMHTDPLLVPGYPNWRYFTQMSTTVPIVTCLSTFLNFCSHLALCGLGGASPLSV